MTMLGEGSYSETFVETEGRVRDGHLLVERSTATQHSGVRVMVETVAAEPPLARLAAGELPGYWSQTHWLPAGWDAAAIEAWLRSPDMGEGSYRASLPPADWMVPTPQHGRRARAHLPRAAGATTAVAS